jgi:hypothetical protein
MRFLHRLRDQIAAGHREIPALVAGIRVHHQHIGDLFQGFLPHGAALRRIDPEAFQLRAGGRLPRAKVDPAVGDEIQGGQAFRDARGVVIPRRQEHDAVPQPKALRALRGRRQKHFGGGRVRVLFQKMVFDLPGVIKA